MDIHIATPTLHYLMFQCDRSLHSVITNTKEDERKGKLLLSLHKFGE